MRSIPVYKADDPWFDPWTARIKNIHGRVLGVCRLPCSPPYTIGYRPDIRVVLGSVEFLDYKGQVRAVWEEDKVEVLGGGTWSLEVMAYNIRRQ
jgi:hypothetical protein